MAMPTSAEITLFDALLMLVGAVRVAPRKYRSPTTRPRHSTSRLRSRGSSPAREYARASRAVSSLAAPMTGRRRAPAAALPCPSAGSDGLHARRAVNPTTVVAAIERPFIRFAVVNT
jgi:hypothetical protein